MSIIKLQGTRTIKEQSSFTNASSHHPTYFSTKNPTYISPSPPNPLTSSVLILSPPVFLSSITSSQMSYSFRNRVLFPVLINTAFFFLLLTAVIQEAKSVDPKFEHCEPRSCGHGPNISYPFWIPVFQNQYCGYPGYEVSCLNEEPALLISNESYLITDIFYANHSLPVVSAKAESNNCPVPLHNLTLQDTPYQFSSTPSNLFFFYNCSISVKSITGSFQTIDCGTSINGNYSFAYFEGSGTTLSHSRNICQSKVTAPVDTNGMNNSELQEISNSALLKRGFLLKWTGNRNCSKCEASGGRCGFNNEEFWCFCPNGSHGVSCTSLGSTLNWTKPAIGIVPWLR
ncbi:hypothetical protein NE237_007510 [Protea cynaroides]|uniref:Uncharacterized protein n=1 Tax=Protea cynaroides TaxID=273540 RepID=A0A9Q0KPK9_9MAGN|nr:hypothetical protein NE237_007510 [Protea cynaroides]